MTLVDSNILIDIFSLDPAWSDWSASRLDDAIVRGPVVINDVIFAETAIRYNDVRQLENALSRLGIDIAPMPHNALFFAGKAYVMYRRTGGLRTGVLPDFFIGAHAAVLGIPILTRDTRRYQIYFPTVELIGPKK